MAYASTFTLRSSGKGPLKWLGIKYKELTCQPGILVPANTSSDHSMLNKFGQMYACGVKLWFRHFSPESGSGLIDFCNQMKNGLG